MDIVRGSSHVTTGDAGEDKRSDTDGLEIFTADFRSGTFDRETFSPSRIVINNFDLESNDSIINNFNQRI